MRRGVRVTLKRLKIVRKPSGAVLTYYRAPAGALTRLPDGPHDAPAFLAAYARAADQAPAAKGRRPPADGPWRRWWMRISTASSFARWRR